MNFARTFAIIVVATSIFTACNSDSEGTIGLQENTNSLLAYVPADTAYVFADLEAVPENVTNAYIARFQPVLNTMSSEIEQFQQDYAGGAYDDEETARFATVVLDELGGSLSVESLEKLGINLQGHFAFYGIGIFPVVRFELGDAQMLRNTIGRIEAKMGVEIPVRNFNGTDYWRFSEGDMPFGVYFAILDEQFAFTAFPLNAEGTLLAGFLGQDLPANNMASNNALAELNSKNGYSGYGSGVINFEKVSAEIFNENSITRTYLGSEYPHGLSTLDDVCIDEINSMISKAPRMSGGVTSLTANELGVRYDLEIDNPLLTGLASLVSETPAATEGDYLLSASLAIQVGKLRNFVLEKATNIATSPYQCEQLQELNGHAVELVEQLNIPMPPMINNLNGLRVRVDDFDANAELFEADGLFAVHVDKPEMFVGMATMMVPGFDKLDLANQSEPVRIPADILRTESPEVFALMGKSSLGAAVGEKHTADLKQFMAIKAENDGVFLSVSHDMAKQMEIQEALSDKMGFELEHTRSGAHELSDAVRESYSAMLGRSRVEMRMGENGLVIDSRMTFK